VENVFKPILDLFAKLFELIIQYLDNIFPGDDNQQHKEGGNMDIIALLQALSQTIAELQQKLSDAQAASEEIKAVYFEQGKLAGIEEGKVLGFADGKVAGYDEGYAKGLEDGKAQGGNGDKIYSQEELDQKIAEVVAPLNEKISSMEVELQSVKDSIPQAVADGIAAFKSELKVKFAELKSVEDQAESSFESILN
jgi:flagellar biosynthesis/type III secretory pathway protein FliH